MPRSIVFALALVLLALGAATASAKPKVAVLGVEVTGTIDQASTGVAHDLTEGMRSRSRQGNGPYQLAPNSDRELIDEKVLKNCDSEGPLCMSDIGKDIGADILIYGKLEKTPRRLQADGQRPRRPQEVEGEAERGHRADLGQGRRGPHDREEGVRRPRRHRPGPATRNARDHGERRQRHGVRR